MTNNQMIAMKISFTRLIKSYNWFHVFYNVKVSCPNVNISYPDSSLSIKHGKNKWQWTSHLEEDSWRLCRVLYTSWNQLHFRATKIANWTIVLDIDSLYSFHIQVLKEIIYLNVKSLLFRKGYSYMNILS